MPLRIATEEQRRRRAVFSATSGPQSLGAGRRCSLDQYPNRYRRFARAVAGAQTPSGAHHAISGIAH